MSSTPHQIIGGFFLFSLNLKEKKKPDTTIKKNAVHKLKLVETKPMTQESWPAIGSPWGDRSSLLLMGPLAATVPVVPHKCKFFSWTFVKTDLCCFVFDKNRYGCNIVTVFLVTYIEKFGIPGA